MQDVVVDVRDWGKRLRLLATRQPPEAATEAWVLESAARALLEESVDGVPIPPLPAGVSVEGVVKAGWIVRDMVRGAERSVLQEVERATERAGAAVDAARAREAQSVKEEQAKYLSFLSHDLRGGLNGILLMIEVLKRDLAAHPQFASQVDDLDMLRRSVLETVALMDRFIYAERFRRGLVKVRSDRLDLRTVGEQLKNQFEAEAAEKGKQLELEARGTISTDRSLLLLIAVNLVGNAVRFSHGSIIRARLTGADQGWVLEVEDGGPGLPSPVAESLRTTVEPTAIGTGQNTGIGLKLARLAAREMGARFVFESSATRTWFEIAKW